MSFTLDNLFTDKHQINLVVEDKQRQHAIFVTQSLHKNIGSVNNPIDHVTLMKIVLGSDEKFSY